MKPASLAAAIVLDIVAIAHLLRIVFQVNVVIGGWTLPMWVSGVGCVVATALSLLIFLEARSKPS